MENKQQLNKDILQEDYIIVQPVNTDSLDSNLVKEPTEASEVALGLACFMIFAFSANAIVKQFKKRNKAKTANEIFHLRHYEKHPCCNCRFFNNNFDLKCAIHPSSAFKKESLHCSDFWARNSDKFAHTSTQNRK